MDAFFAILLFTLVIALIYLFSISFNSLQQQYVFADDLLNLVDRVKINDLDLVKYSGIASLNIKDKNVTIIEQVVTYYNQSNFYAINKTLDDLTLKLRGNYKFGLYIGDVLVYGNQSSGVSNLVARSRISIIKRIV